MRSLSVAIFGSLLTATLYAQSPTLEQMDALAGMTGPDFDRMWLEMMIAHHQGAIAQSHVEVPMIFTRVPVLTPEPTAP